MRYANKEEIGARDNVFVQAINKMVAKCHTYLNKPAAFSWRLA